MRPWLILTLMMASLAGQRLDAQAGSTTDIITGRVTGPEGEALAGAQVVAVGVESEIRRSTVSNEEGRFTLTFPDGEGSYRLQVSFLGMAPTVREIRRRAVEDVLIANVQLDVSPIALEGLSATAARQRQGGEIDPGADSRTLSGQVLNRLPGDPSDLERIATLVPGVAALPGGDSIALAFSVLGQGPVGNQTTLDGLTFSGVDGVGGSSGIGIPAEAIRTTRVITNSYDVSQGQFSGGMIATTTRRGNNHLGGSLTYGLTDPVLQWTDAQSPFGGSVHQSRVSGAGGGAILQDKLFFFGGGSLQRRSEGLASLLSADAASLSRLGVSPDSVQKMLEIASSLGIFDSGAPFNDDRGSAAGTLLGRFDYYLHPRHTLTLRGDARWSDQDAFRTSPLALPQEGGTRKTNSDGILATLTSQIGTSWINELRAYLSHNARLVEPGVAIPAGRVRVSSELDDGAQSVSTLSFGSGTSAIDSRSTSLEIANDLSLLLGLTHRVRVGGVFNSVRSSQANGTSPYGTFLFPSLEAFSTNTPSSFTRILGQEQREAGGVNGALYVSDTWRATEALQLTLGVRAEASALYDEPEHNAQVEQLFGRRTDTAPTELAVTPRLGFSYVLGGTERPTPLGLLRGGIGGFRATPPWQVFSAAAGLTGLPGTQVQVACTGRAIPAPDWSGYQADPSSIPVACANGEVETRGAGRGSTVAFIDEGFRAPQSWRASLGFQRELFANLGFSIDAAMTRGIALQGLRDLNLNTVPGFLLTAEGNRPVYVPADAIAPATAEPGFFASRLHPEFGEVLEVHSDAEMHSEQLTFQLSGVIPRSRTIFNASYSYTRARDQGSAGGYGFGRYGRGGSGGLGALGETAANPNLLDWATSDFERRHLIMLSLGASLASWADVTMLGRASSGAPFTPLVGTDINGDGARNDLAFVFDPAASADPDVAGGMSRLLENSSDRVRSCLQAQLGQIAERNSCVGPWSYAFDLRLNLRPVLPGLGRRLTIAVDAVNTLSGLDRLLHGEDGLHGWGQTTYADPVLLYPLAFDPESRAYRYEVNETFGDSRSNRTAFRDPFQLQIQGQITLGQDRQGAGGGMRGLGGRSSRGGSAGSDRGGGRERMDRSTFLERMFVNPVMQILALRDSLGLAPDQVERLAALSDSLQLKLDSLSAPVREQIEGAQAAGSMVEIMQAAQPQLRGAQEETQRALAEVKQILTREQWGSLPKELREVDQVRGGASRSRP